MVYYRISKNEKFLFFGKKNRPGVGSDLNHFETYKLFKNLVTREIRKSKKEVLNKLTENLASLNLKQNGWRKTLKHFII